ncbi:MAG: sulfite exporter TauE/SafE family protein [Candidatus Tectomicrobia bacterium]|uniref:Probable membrane transporter protein n=1 Tax=Tectimicrobiota bacterium TaxID=2528274 RepID=A0A938B249_UNCTE|nr:sulfite exporter TauE/SafE family protein [Candidatus Tectomicrobia bacterium]
MELEWIAGAMILALASFVFGLAGFGIGVMAQAFLPLFMPPTVSVPLVAIYGAVFALVMAIQMRRYTVWRCVLQLFLGALLGVPLGVWSLTNLPPQMLRRVLGLVLVGLVFSEFYGVYPKSLTGRYWSYGAGFISGLLGGAVGVTGPPVALYAATQPWKPPVMKATLQNFLLANQGFILFSCWWSGLVTPPVLWRAVSFALPAIAGVALGIYCFYRVDYLRFRRIIFMLLGVMGAILCLRG